MERFDGYGVTLFLDEDGEWLAHFMEMPNISAFGNTPEEALQELEIVWALLKESYKKMERLYLWRLVAMITAVRSMSGSTGVFIGHWRLRRQYPEMFIEVRNFVSGRKLKLLTQVCSQVKLGNKGLMKALARLQIYILQSTI